MNEVLPKSTIKNLIVLKWAKKYNVLTVYIECIGSLRFSNFLCTVYRLMCLWYWNAIEAGGLQSIHIFSLKSMCNTIFPRWYSKVMNEIHSHKSRIILQCSAWLEIWEIAVPIYLPRKSCYKWFFRFNLLLNKLPYQITDLMKDFE